MPSELWNDGAGCTPVSERQPNESLRPVYQAGNSMVAMKPSSARVAISLATVLLAFATDATARDPEVNV